MKNVNREACSGIPDDEEKKHPCEDCRYCQWCSDDRCRLCMGQGCKGRKLSMQEQIELYEAKNRDKSES